MSRAPRETARLFGHDEARRIFDRAWQSGRLHHAWLLTGAPGIGKATLAFGLARTILGGADPQAAGRRIAAASHPDLLVVSRAIDEKRQRPRSEIVLDDVRPIGLFLRRTAAEGGWRVVIVDGAEHLNRNAANALLKLLEEPPAKAILLLVCSAPGRLLPTIRSRTRRLRLAPLDDAVMLAALDHLLPEIEPGDRKTLVALSGGSPGQALALAAEDGVALSGLVEDALSQSGQGPGLWCYALADGVLRRESGFSIFLGLLSSAISKTIADTIRGTENPAHRGLPVRRMSQGWTQGPAQGWAETCVELARLRDETERLNLDKRQALLTGLGLLSGI